MELQRNVGGVESVRDVNVYREGFPCLSFGGGIQMSLIGVIQ